jgi:hypothetical protein
VAKKFRVGDLFTADEIARAKALYDATIGTGTFARKCARDIVRPALPRIEKITGQENNELYLAYALELALGQLELFDAPPPSTHH